MSENDPSESKTDESESTRERATAIDLDAAFALLADAERRAILTYLRGDADGTATPTELIDHVRQRHGDANDVLAPDRVTVRVHHQHLPKLVDAEVVEYDRRSEAVRYRGNSVLEALLDGVRSVSVAQPVGETQADETQASDATSDETE